MKHANEFCFEVCVLAGALFDLLAENRLWETFATWLSTQMARAKFLYVRVELQK